jgi:CheY-like chemotaxis protein
VSHQKLRVIIIGDEMGQGEALQLALIRAGHEVEWVQKPDEAAISLSQYQFDFIICDCMLQGSMNGVDLIMHIKESYNQSSAHFILMSAIFTEKNFIKEAIHKTKAIAFIEKKANFDPAQVVKHVVKLEDEGTKINLARKELYQIFSREKVSQREKRKIIESLDEVSGFDLPFIYSLLVETKSSGYLNIYGKNSAVSGITLSEGCIISVDVEDKTTYLGEMMIQSGYALPDDVHHILSEKTNSNQKIGFRMIQGNFISPHAFDLILSDQMNIRLSRTIIDQPVRINFASAEVEKTNPYIDSEQLLNYLHDWIAAKISLVWLKSLYAVWSGHSIIRTPLYNSQSQVFEMPLMQSLSGLNAQIEKSTNINLLLENKLYNEVAVYKGIHFLLTRGFIQFEVHAHFKTEAEQLTALKKISKDIQGKSAVEILDLYGLENLQNNEYMKLIGDKPSEKNVMLSKMWEESRVIFEDTIRKASDKNFRSRAKQDGATKDAELRLRTVQLIDEIKNCLVLSQFAQARAKVTELQKLNMPVEQLHLYTAWTKLGLLDQTKKVQLLKEIEFDLLQVPAEEKYNAHYPFVVGLLQKHKGDLMQAKKQFEKSIGLDSSLMVARREHSAVVALLKKEGEFFGNVDLKSLVSGFFGKKS